MSVMKRMKVARALAGIRQIDLSRQTGIPCSALSLIENGLREPNSEQAQMINNALNEKIFKNKISTEKY